MQDPINLFCFDVINDIMNNLIYLLKNNEQNINGKIINKLSNLFLIITSNWNSNNFKIPDEDNFYQKITEIFRNLYSNKNIVSFNALISLNTFLLKIIFCDSPKLISVTLFEQVCGLLNNSLQMFSKQLSTVEDVKQSFSLEKRLITSNLFVSIEMLQKSGSNHCRFLSVIRQFEISQQVFNLMIHLIFRNIHIDLAQNLPTFFVSLSYYENGANLLYNHDIVNNFFTHFNVPSELYQSQTEESQLNSINTILSLLIRTVINMLIHLKHHFIEHCVSFIAIYSDTFKAICKNFRLSPNMKNSKLVLLIFELYSTQSKYVNMWRDSHQVSLNIAIEEILLTSNSVIAFILRPNVIAQALNESSMNPVLNKQRRLLNINDYTKTPMFENLNDLLIQLLTHSMMFIKDVSPNFFELFECEESAVEKYSPLISTNFSHPNTDSTEILTFGSIISLVNFIIKFIYKVSLRFSRCIFNVEFFCRLKKICFLKSKTLKLVISTKTSR